MLCALMAPKRFKSLIVTVVTDGAMAASLNSDPRCRCVLIPVGISAHALRALSYSQAAHFAASPLPKSYAFINDRIHHLHIGKTP